MSAVKFTDEATKAQIATHEIERISFVVIDPRDTRAFGYIYNTADDRHQFWAIKTERAAAATVLALKELFELAFEKYTLDQANNNNKPPASTITQPSPTETSPVAAVPIQQPTPTQTVPVSPPPPSVPVSPPPPANVPVYTVPPPSLVPISPTTPASLLDGNIWGIDSTTPVSQPVPPAVIDIFNMVEPPVIKAPPPPSKPVNPLEDLFDSFSAATPITTQPTVAAAPPSNPLFDIFSNPTPTSAPPPTSWPNNIYSSPPQPNPVNTFPNMYQQPQQPITFPTMPPLQPQMNFLSPTPTSPVAPPTVSNPVADFDFLRGLTTTTKTTKEAFFPASSTNKTIQQLQMEKQP
jgi:hypothetical protein